MSDREVVFVRHGQSTWNRENRFTGWTDVGLSEQGVEEASSAGRVLKHAGFVFDEAHISYLRRAQETLDLVLAAMAHPPIPICRTWLINERHYGALQGLNKTEIREKYGEAQFREWRRGYATRPPALAPDDLRHPRFDPLWADVPPDQLPATESLADTRARVERYWQETLARRVAEGRRILVSAHGNSMRALLMFLEGLSESEVVSLEIPTGQPVVYTVSADGKPLGYRYLGSEAAVGS